MAIKLKKPKPLSGNSFPEIPDPFGYGQRAVDFLRGLKHHKSQLPGRAFQLDPWQERIVRMIYGPCDDQGRRICGHAVILIGRGNRKTSLGAALALLHTLGPEAVPGGEVLFAAGDQKQARIAYTEAMNILMAGDANLWKKGQASKSTDPTTAIRFQDYRNTIRFPNGSFLEALSNDSGTQHGRTPAFALCDEIHAWKKRDLWDVIGTGLAKTDNSLRITITTGGRGQDTIGYEVIERARKVAKGDITDPFTLPFLFEAPAEADWRDESVWLLANPGLPHGYPSLNGLRQEAREAEDSPAGQDAFRQLHLNMWLDRSTSPFVDMAIYDKGAAPLDLDTLKGQPCWLGVDLGMTDDLSAVVAAFRDPSTEDGYIVRPWFFMPGDNLDKRTIQSGFPYLSHAEAGRIITTPGNVTDYRMIEAHIRDLAELYQLREIAFDPHYAGMLMTSLGEDGFPVVAFRQGWVTMGPAIKELERAILAGKFRHGGHPVLRWNFANIAIQDDGKGNKSFNKSKSSEKIDGAVATAMAVARAAQGEDNRSVYDTEDRSDGLMIW
ncbi:terminase large subunit [Pararhodobacter aggregans]|uniref:Terminase n=1 Tax=Pararhodobacter aggregans TaxID=404875 RepID=A0A2T7UWE7_9RHOB|nr:terminase TerL endonuclease subunit [Pararhodobacter aggregans]PTX04613.1 phage terminase large subunit-like protein [Pararhodobacter aggregans]PVE48954.1 terminase [Pararhodobacter aggregans]